MPSDASADSRRERLVRPITAGVVSALVGFTSSFAVTLTGFTAVGADRTEAASGLLAVSVAMGLGSIVLATWTQTPITIAWSTPGAALLAATGPVEGGWPAAVGGFLITGLLILLTGLIPRLVALIARIPAPIAQAMLAGVLLRLCLGPISGLAHDPRSVAPVVIVWLLAARFAARWAAPVAFLAAGVVIAVHVASSGASMDPAGLAPHLQFTAPVFTVGGVVGIGLPLYLVTMAGQNVPGAAVMKGLGYEVPWRRAMFVTGAGTALVAPAGGHAINLAAITAALAAGPEAGADRSRRWVASVTGGSVIVVLGIAATAFGTLLGLAPEGLLAAVAGLALIGVLAAALQAAVAEPADRVPATIAFATAASGIAVSGISAASWALVAGLALRAFMGRRAS